MAGHRMISLQRRHAAERIQDIYLDSLQIHSMNRNAFNRFKFCINSLDPNDPKVSHFRDQVSNCFQTVECILESKQGKYGECYLGKQKQQASKNQSNNSGNSQGHGDSVGNPSFFSKAKEPEQLKQIKQATKTQNYAESLQESLLEKTNTKSFANQRQKLHSDS